MRTLLNQSVDAIIHCGLGPTFHDSLWKRLGISNVEESNVATTKTKESGIDQCCKDRKILWDMRTSLIPHSN